MREKPIENDVYKNLFTIVTNIKKWNDVIDFYGKMKEKEKKEKRQWIFRGQRDSDWGLTTSIERLAVKKWDRPFQKLPEIESGLIRAFRRRFHNYSQYRPEEDDYIEWLSIMQHHGTVTRLLDCTYSFYAALFFALQEASPHKKKMSTVWAFESRWLYEIIYKKIGCQQRHVYKFSPFEDVVTNPKRDNYFLFKRRPAMSCIYPVNALKLNKRLIIQQGVFLAPGNITQTFIKNLELLSEGSQDHKDHLYLILLPNTEEFLKDAIRELHRMNMNSATLFQGLDGFARFLNKGVCLPELIKPG